MDDLDRAGVPHRYLLAWEDFPHRRDLGRFVAAQINDLGGLPLSPAEGEALVAVLEDLGLVSLHDETFAVPILDLTGWTPLVEAARAALEDEADPPLAVPVRVRATPPSILNP